MFGHVIACHNFYIFMLPFHLIVLLSFISGLPPFYKFFIYFCIHFNFLLLKIKYSGVFANCERCIVKLKEFLWQCCRGVVKVTLHYNSDKFKALFCFPNGNCQVSKVAVGKFSYRLLQLYGSYLELTNSSFKWLTYEFLPLKDFKCTPVFHIYLCIIKLTFCRGFFIILGCT